MTCHQRRVGAQDAADIGLLRTWSLQEGACAPGTLCPLAILYDDRSTVPGPLHQGGILLFFVKVLAASVALRVSET